ncbi:MAG: SMC-Scp complex subunit ScpB [Deferrisomatales bacterium]|nr:SMC-Scp complex subunit ScpB [Deferrisomatales bacterium]
MDTERIIRILEALLLVSPEPVPLARLEEVFAPDGVPGERVRQALAVLGDRCKGRGVEVREVAGGYQLRTRPDVAPWLARLEAPKAARFSRPALEVLAIVAYRQPVTRAEVEEVRGVDCGGVLKTLLDKGLVRILGKKDVAGRPLLYGTSRKFLESFGLSSLADLPSLRDIEDLLAERAEAVIDDGTLSGGGTSPEEGPFEGDVFAGPGEPRAP